MYLFIFAMLAVIAIPLYAEEGTTTAASLAEAAKFIGMALAVAGSTIGAGYAVGQVGAAGAAAIIEKPEIMGRILIFLGLAEGIAIYGILIALIIWIA